MGQPRIQEPWGSSPGCQRCITGSRLGWFGHKEPRIWGTLHGTDSSTDMPTRGLSVPAGQRKCPASGEAQGLAETRPWMETLCGEQRTLLGDKEYVGFATLPNQLHRKSVKKGFDFTLMVAGESGLGKSTLIDSLFLTDLYKDRTLLDAQARIPQTLVIERRAVELEEGGVRVKLTVVDTPGFGDAVDNADCWGSIVDYIDQQFEQFFRDESGLNRKNITDGRVHCCLYFLSPFGHGLRPLDVAFLRAVQHKVNIVPVIGRADALTPREVGAMKEKIRQELEENAISIYQFPDCDSDEDEEFKAQDAELKRSIPFAVVGSNDIVRETKEKAFRGRTYPWGAVEVENPAHCDFLKLRTMLVRTHMHDLKEVTQEIHYENYRAQCIQSLSRVGARDRASRMKLSRQSATELPLLPLETEKLIREKDEELRRMQEMLQKMQAQMQQSQGEQSAAL
ncbi:septin-1 isoform X1 [Gopherus evgoodei]|uniref:Septin 1 n=1 Tax=Gopherus evgoodei TaxID=1825980 RepID=A0A8C4YF61_9SAUR|nr:septin-1 isoform X1 [Gopherus evgoodei]